MSLVHGLALAIEVSLALTDGAFFPNVLITLQVTLATKELSGQDLTKFYGEINSIIKVLLQSADSEDKLCGVLFIGRQRRTCTQNYSTIFIFRHYSMVVLEKALN